MFFQTHFNVYEFFFYKTIHNIFEGEIFLFSLIRNPLKLQLELFH